jgi:hypothetical protein
MNDEIQGFSDAMHQESKGEILKHYTINIQFHSIGCVIEVGCKSVAFSTVEEGMRALIAYVENPFEEKKKWNKIFGITLGPSGITGSASTTGISGGF